MQRSFVVASFVLSIALAAYPAPLEGKVSGTDGKPVANCFLATLTSSFSSTGNTTTGADGKFSLGSTPKEGFLVVQPAAGSGPGGVQAYPYQPRLYQLGPEEKNLDLKLPPAFSLVLEAYDGDGKLLRWQDFEARGKLGGQFLYATNLDDEGIPMTAWPAHGDAITGRSGGPRETAAPAVLVQPGQVFAVNVLFWPVPDYGKLMVKADNGGVGYSGKQGAAQVVLLNYELARTAVAEITKRAKAFGPASAGGIQDLQGRLQKLGQLKDRKEQARASDRLLSDALMLRDDLELALARAQIPKVRMGTIKVQVEGKDKAGWKIAVREQRRNFLFGVFEGSPYNAVAFEAARDAGFELATVLFGWNWTDSPKARQSDIDKVYGLKMLEKLGYSTKAHGVVWLQAPPILPDKALKMAPAQLTEAALNHQQALLEAFGEEIEIWEAMNEPANTNVVKLPREKMMNLMADAAANIAAVDKPVLVNSPHEFSFGSKYIFHGTNNEPMDDYPITFSAFLTQAQQAGKLKDVSILGLQIYPGLHFNQDWGNLQGPAYTPSYFQDTLDRYSRFGKGIHITEFSLPSTYEPDWTNGYWRKEWDEETQADYAERIYTLAFAHPQVHSVGWWDIVDDKSSVISGGLIKRGGKPKLAFQRIKELMEQWSTNAEVETDAEGKAELPAFGGEYEITATSPSGKKQTQQMLVLEGWTAHLELK